MPSACPCYSPGRRCQRLRHFLRCFFLEKNDESVGGRRFFFVERVVEAHCRVVSAQSIVGELEIGHFCSSESDSTVPPPPFPPSPHSSSLPLHPTMLSVLRPVFKAPNITLTRSGVLQRPPPSLLRLINPVSTRPLHHDHFLFPTVHSRPFAHKSSSTDPTGTPVPKNDLEKLPSMRPLLDWLNDSPRPGERSAEVRKRQEKEEWAVEVRLKDTSTEEGTDLNDGRLVGNGKGASEEEAVGKCVASFAHSRRE